MRKLDVDQRERGVGRVEKVRAERAPLVAHAGSGCGHGKIRAVAGEHERAGGLRGNRRRSSAAERSAGCRDSRDPVAGIISIRRQIEPVQRRAVAIGDGVPRRGIFVIHLVGQRVGRAVRAGRERAAQFHVVAGVVELAGPRAENLHRRIDAKLRAEGGERDGVRRIKTSPCLAF